METGSTGLYRTILAKGYANTGPYSLRQARDRDSNPNDFGGFFEVTTKAGYAGIGRGVPEAGLPPVGGITSPGRTTGPTSGCP
jgi:hypothetical protein